jgi:2-C-methyl-D-erythritol 4-phosphate cytidylyltransferase/2-C-methyl-D-erythritol 2,4-cyclodiphosphate synthase
MTAQSPVSAEPTIGVIVVAAGSGQRMGAGVPKAFIELDGRRLVDLALERIAAAALGAQVVVAVPAGLESSLAIHADVQVVTGGSSRHESVSAGLAALRSSVTTVLVHDAARALAPADVFVRIADAVIHTGHGAVPVLAVVDALKTIDPATGELTGLVDRNTLRAVQTPQGFVRADLERAHAQAPAGDHQDDAAVYLAAGYTVDTVAGAVEGFKITHPEDIARAVQVLRPEGRDLRVGTGSDVHAFDETLGLHLAGLHFPDEHSLAGHSDGDSASHAIVDALLAAAQLGDIGGMVGTDDPRFKNAHGDVLIAEAVARVRAAGFEAVNVTVQIIGNRPKMASRRLEAERVLTQWVGAPVSVSATTSDGLGITGEGLGIAAIATALVARR